MKFIDDIKKKQYIKYIQKCKYNTRIWMRQYGFRNTSDIKSVGYNNLPDYVERHIVSVASVDELINSIKPFSATYLKSKYYNSVNWNVHIHDSYGCHSNMAATIIDSIFNYSYKRQYAFFIKLLGKTISDTIDRGDSTYGENDYKTVRCTPLTYNKGELIFKLMDVMTTKNFIYKGIIYKGINVKANITRNVLTNIYIDTYINKIPFPTLIDSLASALGYNTFNGPNHSVFLYACRYLGYTCKTMININCATGLSNYQPNMVSLGDYILRHLCDINLYKRMK